MTIRGARSGRFGGLVLSHANSVVPVGDIIEAL